MAQAVQQQAVPMDAEVITDEQADALIAQYIVPNPNKSGRHEAKVDAEGGSPSAWVVISLLSGGESIAGAADSRNLPQDAVRAVIAYYRRHQALIDAKLLLHNEGWMA